MTITSKQIARLHRSRPDTGAADRPWITELAQVVRRANRAHEPLHRAPRALAARTHREPYHGVEVDTVKPSGRRYGPTPLRLLLPADGNRTQPLTPALRSRRYRIQNNGRALTARQLRRMRKKISQTQRDS